MIELLHAQIARPIASAKPTDDQQLGDFADWMTEVPNDPTDQSAMPADLGALTLPMPPLNQGLAPQADRQSEADLSVNHSPQQPPHWAALSDAEDKTSSALYPEDMLAIDAVRGLQPVPHPLSGQEIPSPPSAQASSVVSEQPATVARRPDRGAFVVQELGKVQSLGSQGPPLSPAEQVPQRGAAQPPQGDAELSQLMAKPPQIPAPAVAMPVTVRLSAAPPLDSALLIPEITASKPALPQPQVDPLAPDLTAAQIDTSATPRPANPSPPRPAQPAAAASLHSQLLQHASAAIERQVEVSLAPQELGHVKFQIRHQGETVAILLSAERGETMELLRRHSDELMREFRQAGFGGASLEFGHWGRQPSQQQTPAAFVLTEEFAPPPSLPRPPPLSSTSGEVQGLNLRL